MFFKFGLLILFFLPVIESFDRQIGFNLLLIGAILISFSTFWHKKLRYDLIELLWILMLIVFSISTVYSWSLSRSFAELLRYFAYFLIFISFRRFPDLNFLFKRFLVPMVIINTLILVSLAIIYAIPFFRLSVPPGGMNLFFYSYGHNRLSDLLIFTLPLAISLAVYEKKNLRKALIILSVTVFILMLTATMARGALIALAFAMFIYILINIKNKDWYSWIIGVSTIATIFLTVSFIFSNFVVSPEKAKQLPKFLYKNAQSENRLDYFKQGFDTFLANPLLGTGLDTFRYVSRINSASPNAVTWYIHNHYLQLFSETGFLGGLLFTCLIILILFIVFINPQPKTHNPQLYSGLFIAVLASVLHSLIDYDWQYLSVFLLLWISLSLLSPSVSPEKNDKYLGRLSSNPKILFLLIICIFSFFIFFEINSDKLLASADKLTSEKKLQEAKIILEKAYRMDFKNSEITWRLANIASAEKNYAKAHALNQKTVLLYPFNSRDIIRNDLFLYLTEAKDLLDNKKYQEGYKLISDTIKLYPFYYQFIGGDYFIINAQKHIRAKDNIKASVKLKEYIKIMQKQMNKKKLSDAEIIYIARNLTTIVY